MNNSLIFNDMLSDTWDAAEWKCFLKMLIIDNGGNIRFIPEYSCTYDTCQRGDWPRHITNCIESNTFPIKYYPLQTRLNTPYYYSPPFGTFWN
jgi:hypothetical protein